MIAFGFLLFIIAIFVLINTLNGNLPGLVNIPGVHDATVGIRGLLTPTASSSNTTGFTPMTGTGLPLGDAGSSAAQAAINAWANVDKIVAGMDKGTIAANLDTHKTGLQN